MGHLSNNILRFDTERLDAIPIEDVLEAIGAERIGNSKKFKCFNKAAHKSDDKSASMSVHPKENYCNCFGCNTGGSPIAIVTAKMGGDFKEACIWLHDAFRIPYQDGLSVASTQRFEAQKPKEPEYLSFDSSRPYNSVVLDEWLPHYDKLNDERRLKLIYTFIYRFSLQTDQRPKITYHTGRGIDVDHPMLKNIGYLSPSDIRKLAVQLENLFPKEDLIRFNLFSPMDQDFYPGSWKYWSKTGFCLAPSVDLYTDMCNGFMLRNTDGNLDKKKLKEIQVSRSNISLPLPFGLTRELLLSNKSIPIYANEGYIDGLSLGKEKLFVAATGVHGLKEKVLGLFRDREVRLAYDMDNAGIRAMRGYYTVSVKRPHGSGKDQIATRYFLQTEDGSRQKDRYTDRIHKWTSLVHVEKRHLGLVDKIPQAGARVVVVSWETKIDRNKFVTDINEILKEYRKAYQTDLTGKSVEQAVVDLRCLYAKEPAGKQICLSG